MSTWSLGPLTISNAVMMTMDLEGLVRGAPGKVIGIVGYDVFRRAVVELPQLSGPAAAAGQLSPSETSGSGGGSSGGSGGGSGRSPAAGGGGGGGGSGQRNGAGSRRSAARATPESTCSLHLHSPELYPAERAALWVWHPIKMVRGRVWALGRRCSTWWCGVIHQLVCVCGGWSPRTASGI